MEIPKAYEAEVLTELDKAHWDCSDFPALWVLLNKLKLASGWPDAALSRRVEWEDLKDEGENPASHKKYVKTTPHVEFEGPMGRFWPMWDVPLEALLKGKKDIEEEIERRKEERRD